MRALLAALILCATVTAASAFVEPTNEETEICTPDAFKLCWREMWGKNIRERVFACLKDHHRKSELSPKCDAVFRAHGL